jgi:predicted ferric reductase
MLLPGNQINKQVLSFSAVLFAGIISPVALVYLWPVPAGINLVWDWANSFGYLSLAICMFLFIYRGRARAFPAFSPRFFANLHRELGYLSLCLLFAHVGMLLLTEPLLLEHLKPTAPLHMLAGVFAFILILLLVTSSVPAARRRLWPDYHVFRHIHAMLAVSIVALIAYHVLGSSFYLNSRWKIVLASTVSLGILIYYLISYYRNYYKKYYRSSAVTPTRISGSSQYSRYISYGCTTLVVLVCLLLVLGNQFE